MKRCFLAIALDKQIQTSLAVVQQNILGLGSSAARKIRCVRRENFHVTLKFLGATQESQIEPLCLELQALATSISCVSATIEGIGAFPHPNRPRVVFANIAQGHKQLQDMANQIENACVNLGFDATAKPQIPHITLARIEGAPKNGLLTAFIERHDHEPFGQIAVCEIVLFESQLASHGPIYKELWRAGDRISSDMNSRQQDNF